MQDIVKVVHAELRGAWRYRWQAVIVTWVLCLLGWLAIYLTPDTYEARAHFYLDTTSALQPFVKNLSVGSDIESQLDLLKELVLGRESLLKVVRETDMNIGVTDPVQLDAVLEGLSANLQLTGGEPVRWDPRQRNRNFAIAYRDTDRERAVKVVQIVLDNFMESTLQRNSQGFRSAQDFLQRQILQQEQRLAEAEQRLADFKRRNINNLPTQEGGYVDNLQREMSELQTLQSQQRVLSSRRQQLTAQLAAEKQYVPALAVPATASAVQPSSGASLDAAIAEAQGRLDQLLRVYTPKHPEVIALEENLAILRDQRRDELAKMGVKDVPDRGSLVANPAWEQIRQQRNQVDVELAAVGGQIGERTARIGMMRSKMETMPEVEAELVQLTRDYDVLRERYGLLLQQLETAKLSETVGETERVDFKILGPPAALSAPVAPPRLLLLIGVLVLGLGAGGVAAFALSKLNPMFDSISGLQAMTGLPVLGAVSATWRDRRQARRRVELIRVAAVGAALVVLFVVVVFARDTGSHFLTGLVS